MNAIRIRVIRIGRRRFDVHHIRIVDGEYDVPRGDVVLIHFLCESFAVNAMRIRRCRFDANVN